MMSLLASLFALSALVSPCDSTEAGASGGTCSLEAQPISSSITVDGSLTEAAWKTAPVASDFRQLKPQEGAPSSQRTVVHVLYGTDALYVGATLYDNQPKRIRARLARRDQLNQADWFEVSIDSYFDQKTARTFAVNAAGVQRDGIVQSGGGPGGSLDTSWDAIWRSEVRITDEGWAAEIRIPYSELRFSEANRQKWGILFRRRIPRNSEVAEWPLVPSSSRRNSLVAQYGVLTGLRNLETGRNIKVAPYTLGRVRTRESSTKPGEMKTISSYDAGAYFELGLGSNATLNATINPDFGQVESDPAVLNLSAFETFFPEKRPFFVQGTDLFDFRIGRRANLLYTRRIGARNPVIGALKLTGRSQSGLSYGVMGATTGSNFTPTRNYAVARLRQDFWSFSRIGAMVTAFDGPARSNGRRRSAAGGVDWDLRFVDNTYQVKGYLSGTHRRTTGPDANPSTGLAASTEIGRIQGAWTYNAQFAFRDADFNPNDTGRMRRNNFFESGAFLSRQINRGQPFGPFQGGDGFIFVQQSWSYQERLNRGLLLFSRFEFLTDGFHSLSLELNGEKLFGGYDLFETRGLWPRARPRSFRTEISATTDTRREWQLDVNLGTTLRSDDGIKWKASLKGKWNIGSRLRLSFKTEYQREHAVIEWASNETFVRQSPNQWAIGEESVAPSDLDELVPLTTGNSSLSDILSDVSPAKGSSTYYVPVYGARDTERLNLTLRSSVALTPDLSVEFFGQLFGARGRYRDFRILSSPDDLDRFSAYPKRHDFATSSFLTNAVLRWEFRPGSELFVVWSQNRRLRRDSPFFYDRRQSSSYERSIPARLTDAFDAFPENAFIVKLRYTFY